MPNLLRLSCFPEFSQLRSVPKSSRAPSLNSNYLRPSQGRAEPGFLEVLSHSAWFGDLTQHSPPQVGRGNNEQTKMSEGRYSTVRPVGREHFPETPKGFIAIRIIQLILAVAALGVDAYVLSNVLFDGVELTMFVVSRIWKYLDTCSQRQASLVPPRPCLYTGSPLNRCIKPP